jgi:hypothetical protein
MWRWCKKWLDYTAILAMHMSKEGDILPTHNINIPHIEQEGEYPGQGWTIPFAGWTKPFARYAWLDNTAILVIHMNRSSGYIYDQQYH